MSSHVTFRTWMDAFGIAVMVLLGAAAIGSLFLNLRYWGISGLVLGRLFNRNDGGGIHSLAILAVLYPTFKWGRRTGTNNIIVAVSAFLTDYYHEGLWNIPYYLYYRMRFDQVPLYAVMAVFCFIWFGTIIYAKKQHNFRHVLYLVPWFVLVTLYVLGIHAYSEDIFGTRAYYDDVWINAYEILEVALFAWSLYFALTRGEKKVPVLATVFRTFERGDRPITKPPRPVTVPAVRAAETYDGVTGFLRYVAGFPTLWLIFIEAAAAYLLHG